MAEVTGGMNPSLGGQKKDINTMPSRQSSVDKNKVGTGEQSSTREDQL